MKMKIKKISVLVLIGMLVGTGLGVMIPTAAAVGVNLPYFDDFDTGSTTGWDENSGNWWETGGVYIQDEVDWYDKISTISGYTTNTNYMLEAKMKAITPSSGHYCTGIVFRYVDNDNYYVALLSYYSSPSIYGGSWLEFYTITNSHWDYWGSSAFEFDPLSWTTLTVDVKEDTFKFYINGNQVYKQNGILPNYCEHRDPFTPLPATGKVGLYSYNTEAYFDDWRLSEPVVTQAGEQVPINDPNTGVGMLFEKVGVEGETIVLPGSSIPRPDLDNFQLLLLGVPWVHYHISTTAVYEGNIWVDITYDATGLSIHDESTIMIRHWQGNQWVDVTAVGYPDTTNHLVRGTVSSMFHLGTDEPVIAPAEDLDVDPLYYDGFSEDPVNNWDIEYGIWDWDPLYGEVYRISNDPWPYFYGWSQKSIPKNQPIGQDDYIIQTKVKVDGILDNNWNGGGLVFRNQGPYQCYAVFLSAIQVSASQNEYWLEFWGWFGYSGSYQIIEYQAWSLIDIDPYDWHTITADVRGNTYDIYFDGNFVFQVTDDTLTWGKAGLWGYKYSASVNHICFDDWTYSIPAATTTGGVPIEPYPDVSVEFSNIDAPGETTAIPSAEYPGPDLGNFFIERVGNFYDISTTAQYNGPITVCLPYDDTGLTLEEELALNIYHWEGNQWVPAVIVSRDTDNNIICAEVSSLSWFFVGYLTIDPPEVTIIGPASGSLFQVDTSVPFTATFTDTDDGDTHSTLWEFESGGNIIPVVGTVTQGNGGGTVIDNIPFINPGVYAVTLTVTDSYGLQGTATTIGDLPAFIVIYDPEGGFVTGGGWIYSQPGAYEHDNSLEGKATFGFVAKYKKGAQVPTGQTEFKFKVADLNFHSTSYQWLVITGSKAKFKGTGTINGGEEYNFKLWATDGALLGGGGEDKFRIKIWQEDSDRNEVVVYDNGMETPLGGGQIVIHKT